MCTYKIKILDKCLLVASLTQVWSFQWNLNFTNKNLFSLLVIKLDGTTPVRYGLRLNMDEKYTGLKKQLSDLCGLKSEQILLAEVHGSNIKVILTILSGKPLIPSKITVFSINYCVKWPREIIKHNENWKKIVMLFILEETKRVSTKLKE